MKLTIPPLKIDEKLGFDPSVDLFGREAFGEQLAKLVEGTNGELVIALDAPWGEGKSTFIKMWGGYVGHVRTKKFRTITFDAFSNDYQKDPFLTLASQFYGLVESDNVKSTKFKEVMSKTIKSLARGALKIGVKAAAEGLLVGSVLDSVSRDVGQVLSKEADTIVADRLGSNKADRKAIDDFKIFLAEDLVGEDVRPVVFIIDELDRCRPDFALELLESIKHIFSVKGVTFILSLNRRQLEASVNYRYGAGITASEYLQKFVNLWCLLPRTVGGRQDYGKKYLQAALRSMREECDTRDDEYAVDAMVVLMRYASLSYRSKERVLTNYAVICNVSGGTSFNEHYQITIGFICFVKAVHPNLFADVVLSRVDEDRLSGGAGLVEFNNRAVHTSDKDAKLLLDKLVTIISYDLGSDRKREAIASSDKRFWDLTRDPTGIISKICAMISSFEAP